MTSRVFNHESIVREYTDDELQPHVRLAQRMMRQWVKDYRESKNEMHQRKIVLELTWWTDHYHALIREIERRNTQN